ncbi:PREDICTED: uncharacterized protein LOC109585474 [Amphimedon queenslandica]|uniref:Uncharacterized protein n=1 Tax=Amphimedon queenslandica TaxID=400682 RepID=A0A1X7VPU4_AMPQE|nr:PREDICTED: uncharacterized protein LOC109585474 [Amphimedon queenslandica]|eukprot:XP_019857130.1 PREDICTED: uncharacterized protein LOC109585474 [Amphimedon queenslandica]
MVSIASQHSQSAKVNLTIMKSYCICVLFLSSFFFLGTVEGGPLHASCQLKWTWSTNCTTVSTAILAQIAKWTSNTCPPNTELCGYKLKSNTTKEITATHTTPVHHYVDDLKMDFTDDGGMCTVDGYSKSEVWYAVLDDGTNYCNLHNLVTGAGLDKMYSFNEATSDDNCTQYSSANCDKY